MHKKHPSILKQQIIWLISTAFGIAAALFWKDTITQIINAYIPSSQNLAYSVYASIIVSLIAIFSVWTAHKVLKE
jgi:membrane protein YdbS with pleckstrin-like domain